MNDYISRQAAITEAHNIIKGYAGYKAWAIVDMLRKLPSADVVEVVRCKDCVWFNTLGCSIDINDDSDKPTENDFCSFGERRTDG